jgi:hypothetical protein
VHGTLAFLASRILRTIDFVVVDDGQDEPDETVEISLSIATGAAVIGPLDLYDCETTALCRFFKQQMGTTADAYRKKHARP